MFCCSSWHLDAYTVIARAGGCRSVTRVAADSQSARRRGVIPMSKMETVLRSFRLRPLYSVEAVPPHKAQNEHRAVSAREDGVLLWPVKDVDGLQPCKTSVVLRNMASARARTIGDRGNPGHAIASSGMPTSQPRSANSKVASVGYWDTSKRPRTQERTRVAWRFATARLRMA
jgi:hypothetical protein